ncbi:N-acetylneuraminate synthase [Cohnella cholangitidis]|uniref:N-acetylneuraminate synthase n=1 Tax=Cohnella cholangitidis TaxID=2598458 RepID=A0A7G5BXL8_9BACL|nr:N-acetylneuraminate synthase [Cohnella cholangitidis]QMV41702.1 N-acetylneuraminate synthase [Cohnella cholangitidis]
MNQSKQQVYIIAEAGVNHNGSIEMAKRLIDVASASGANAVKFQSFKADKLVSRQAPKADYQLATTDSAETQYEMLKKLELSEDDHRILFEYSRNAGIEFLSTPFDVDSLNWLCDELNVESIKISSGDLTNSLLLLATARRRVNVILSTGMSSLGDIEEALGVLAYGYLNPDKEPESENDFLEAYRNDEGQSLLKKHVVLLHCTTEYPAPLNEVNLKAMEVMSLSFGLPVGYSDHTEGIVIPLAATARGAILIEKHFTLDKSLPGPDHKASLDPDELIRMVQGIRQVEQAIGTGLKAPSKSESKNTVIARKSLVATETIQQGSLFTVSNLTVKRPGNGLKPIQYWSTLGKSATRTYLKDEVIE